MTIRNLQAACVAAVLCLGGGTLAAEGGGDLDEEIAVLTVRLVETESWSEYREISGRLAAIGLEAVPALIGLFGEEDVNVRYRTLPVLAGIGEAAVPALIETLQSDDDRLRAMAVATLERLGPDAAEAVGVLAEGLAEGAGVAPHAVARALSRIGEPALPVLIEALEHPSVRIRNSAIMALSWIGSPARPAVPRLMEMLLQPGWEGKAGVEVETVPDTRIAEWASHQDGVARALRRIVADPQEWVPRLIEALEHEDAVTRAGALRGLIVWGGEKSELAPTLKSIAREDANADLRELALRALATVAPVTETAAFLVETLQKAPDGRTASVAVGSLSRMPMEASRFRTELAEIIRERPSLDFGFIHLLGRLKPDAGPIIPVLMEKLDSADRNTRMTALQLLNQTGATLEKAVAHLIEDIEAGRMMSWSLHYIVLSGRVESVMERIGSAGAPAVPALIAVLEKEMEELERPHYWRRALRSSGPSTLESVARILGAIGPAAAPAIPALEDLLQSIDDSAGREEMIGHDRRLMFRTKREVIRALSRMGTEPGTLLPILEKALGHEDQRVRVAALRALDESDIPARVRQLLMEALSDPEPDVRSIALELLGKRRISDARPALLRSLDDMDGQVRSAAAVALHWIDPENEWSLALLREELESDTIRWRRAAARALGSLDPVPEEVIPWLIELLSDRDDWGRAEAAWALGSMGAAAESAVPALRIAARDPDNLVRINASAALHAIGVSEELFEESDADPQASHAPDDAKYRSILERKYNASLARLEVIDLSPTTKVFWFDWEKERKRGSAFGSPYISLFRYWERRYTLSRKLTLFFPALFSQLEKRQDGTSTSAYLDVRRRGGAFHHSTRRRRNRLGRLSSGSLSVTVTVSVSASRGAVCSAPSIIVHSARSSEAFTE